MPTTLIHGRAPNQKMNTSTDCSISRVSFPTSLYDEVGGVESGQGLGLGGDVSAALMGCVTPTQGRRHIHPAPRSR